LPINDEMNSSIYIRKLSEIDHDVSGLGFDDTFGLCKLSDSIKKALLANPFKKNIEVPSQVLGLVENKVVGQEVVFPVRVKAGDKYYEAIAGSGLFVHEKYRKSQLGMKLITKREELSGDGIAIGCGLSQQALPVHLMFDYVCFPMQRLMWVFKSRAIVERMLGKTLFSWGLIGFVDGMLVIATLALRAIVCLRTRGLTITRADHADGTIAALICKDARTFACDHSTAWMNWQLKHSFSSDERCQQRLYTIKDASGQLHGFFTFKIRFHEVASQRGYRNLLLGSLMEWQSSDPRKLSHATLAQAALLEMRACGVDAVEICTDEEKTLRSMKRFFFPKVGELNFVMRVTEGSPLRGYEGWARPANWRLRPSDGDNGLS